MKSQSGLDKRCVWTALPDVLTATDIRDGIYKYYAFYFNMDAFPEAVCRKVLEVVLV